jgi:hypothetical protein
MSQRVVNLKYKKASISSSSGGSSIDLSNGITFFDYYEDILSPCVTGKLYVSFSGSVYNTIPIRGGEKVELELETESGSIKFTGDKALYVYKASDLLQEEGREFFVIHVCSREALTNETSRVQAKYGQSPISEHVKKILKEVLKTSKFNSKNIERTSNSYSFIGTMKKPFYMINWLCPKGIPVSGGASGSSGGGGGGGKGSGGKGIDEKKAKGTAGYLFYENQDGFNFRSIDSLVEKTQSQSGSTGSESFSTYTYTQVVEAGEAASDFTIINYNFERNINLMKSLRTGMYSNETFFYDLYNDRVTNYKYTIKGQIKNKLGKKVPYPKDFAELPSRILFRQSDRGIIGNDPKERNGREEADMAKSFARYNLLFSQALNIVVPCNVKLQVGQIIKIEFPSNDQSSSGVVEVDKEISGLYIIREVCHHFETGQNHSSLKLMRDSYGI